MTELTDDEHALLEMIADRPMLLSAYARWLDRVLLEQLVKRHLVSTVHNQHGTIYGITRQGLIALAE